MKIFLRQESTNFPESSIHLAANLRTIDPSKLTPEEYQIYLNNNFRILDEYRNTKDYFRFPAMAKSIKLLGADPQIRQSDWNEMENFLAKLEDGGELHDDFLFAELASDLKILNPKRLDIGDKDWERMRESLEKEKQKAKNDSRQS